MIPALDLHMHSRFSDGTDSPEALLSLVKAAGMGFFSVTDHDSVDSGACVRTARQAGDPAFVTGVEFSCKDEEGKYHILGYGFDPEAASIKAVVQLGYDYRIRKAKARLNYLTETFGFHFPEEEVATLLALNSPGKPHIGNLMVRLGFAASKEEAIEKYINGAHFRTEYVRPEEAIEGILGGGGIPVLAHPTYGNGDQLILGEEMDARLRRLTAMGLKGVEGYYSGFTPKIRAEILGFADAFGLYVTAGSDYHGTNKSVALGDTGLDEAGEAAPGLRRFLADVKQTSGYCA